MRKDPYGWTEPEEDDTDQGEQEHALLPIWQRMTGGQVMLTGGALVTSGIIDLATHFDGNVVFFGLLGVIFVARHGNDALKYLIPGSDPTRVQAMTARVVDATLPGQGGPRYKDQRPIAKLRRLFSLRREPLALPKEVASGTLTDDTDPVFSQPTRTQNTPSIRRITIAQMVKHTERNSYEVYIGRSLTRLGNPAVKINFFKRHIKLIGASQHGKSSMAAAILETILRTHDPDRVMIALLDLENKTSRLFAKAPHIADLVTDKGTILLHARNEHEVLQHLEYVLALVEYRYTLSEPDMDALPLLIVYLEEFIDLKDYFKQRIDEAKGGEAKAQATRDYSRLVHCIKKIARRGLKVHVQLLICAQVDYRDEDLQEALINVTSGMAFCVRPTAAQAAGFQRAELIKRNAADDQVGQAVVEMPEVKDLILTPDYDLEQKLRKLARPSSSSPVASNMRPLRPVLKPAQSTFFARNEASQNSHDSTLEIEDSHVTFARKEMTLRPDEKPTQSAQTDANDDVARKNEALRPDLEPTQATQNDARYRLSDEQVTMFLALYPNVISNKDKCLEAIGANTAYRAHANELIQQYNLLDKKQG